MQSFEESPTRKVVRKEGKIYYMLEDEDGIPDGEEQRMYRAIIREELGELKSKRRSARNTEDVRMLMEEVGYFDEED